MKMYKYVKRVLDFIISLVLFVILLIPMFIISILIIIIDKQNPIFIQKRTGKNGNIFNLYKFRTMKIINSKNDYTKLGKVLRRLSLDELPQVLNIIKGDMSFVGPRPWIPGYYENMNIKQRRRVEVLPGLTGLAQVNGRNGISVNKKIDYDLEYIDNFSFKQDIYIVFKTICVIFKSENTYLDEKGIEEEIQILKEQA